MTQEVTNRTATGMTDSDFVFLCLRTMPIGTIAGLLRTHLKEQHGEALPMPSMTRKPSFRVPTEHELLWTLMAVRYRDLPIGINDDLDMLSACDGTSLAPDVTVRDMIRSVTRPVEDRTVPENAILARVARARLRSIGIVVKESHVLVSTNHVALAEILIGTPWENNWHAALRRLPGAAPHGTVAFSTNCRSKATAIPLAVALKHPAEWVFRDMRGNEFKGAEVQDAVMAA